MTLYMGCFLKRVTDFLDSGGLRGKSTKGVLFFFLTFGARTSRVFGPWRATTAPGLSLDEIRPKSLRTGGYGENRAC